MAEEVPVVLGDRPLDTPDVDLFGYAPFARMLSYSVLRGSPANGLVVGVYGDWGMGKTTVLNFVEHYLQADTSDVEPIVVRFNPWWFSGREDLVRRFFSEFKSAVLKKKAKNERLRAAFERLGNAVASVPVTWVGALGKGVAAAAKLGQPGDILGLKKDLEDALKAEALRVVVLVDDIDRLPPADVIEVFRLVKAVGDLPNVFYVLAFDRRVVTAALQEQYKDFGAKYVEKIVQVAFDLPLPTRAAIEHMFMSRVASVLGDTPSELWNEAHWARTFVEGVERLITSPRDVTRLVNALSITYPPVRGEVNAPDFIAIEALRLFLPAAYDAIRMNSDQFIGWSVAAMRESPLRASAQEFHKGWIAACGEKGRVAQRIAVQLFPRAGPMIGGSEHVSGNDAEWRIARRICADEVFESYFRYSLGDAFSRLEYLRVLAEGSTQDGARVLRRLAGERTPDGFTRLRRFADMLRDALFVEGMALAQPQDLMGSLCAVGDLAIAGGRNDMITPDDLLLVLIIVRLLASLPISEQRSALQAGLDRAGFDFAARVVSFVGASHGRYGEPASPTEEHAVLESEGDLDYLERYIATRLRAAARDGSLWGKSRVWPLVVFWSKIDPAEARAAVQQWTVDDTNFLHLVLGLVIKDTDVRARLPAKMRWRFNAKTAAAAFDLTTLRPRVTSLLQRGELTNEARETLSLLLEAGSDPEQS